MSAPPTRIQLSRRKGWRKPEGVITVSRPTRWGNSWKVGDGPNTWTVDPGGIINRDPKPPLTLEQAITSFRNSLEYQLADDPNLLNGLRGRDLACWCRLDVACHADVLLELANQA